MRTFVWTEKGKTVHISQQYDPAMTCCGRQVDGPTDAADVLWYPLCKRCKAFTTSQLDRSDG